MRKTFKFKRWMAFLLAFILTATTCMSSADAFLWATDENVEETAASPEESKPAEETQVVDLSDPVPQDEDEPGDGQTPAEESPEVQEPTEPEEAPPAEEPTTEEPTVEDVTDAPQEDPTGDTPDEGTEPVADEVNDEETVAPDTSQTPEENVDDSDKPSETQEEEETGTYSYIISYYYDGVEDENARVTGEGTQGDVILTSTSVENEVVHNGGHYVLDRIENENGTITEEVENNIVKVYYVLSKKEDAENDKEEEAMPVILQASVDGVDVKVEAAAGVLPSDTVIDVGSVAVENIVDKVNTDLEAKGLRATEIKAVDITLKNDGDIIQPKGSVTVKLGHVFNSDIPGDEVMVYHISGSSAEQVGSGDPKSSDIEFTTDHFSIYAAVKAVEGSAVNAVDDSKITVTIQKDSNRSPGEILPGRIEDHAYEVDGIEGYDFVEARYANAAIDEIYKEVSDEGDIKYYVSASSDALTAIEVEDTRDIILIYKSHAENYRVTYKVIVDGNPVTNIADVADLIRVDNVDAGEDLEFIVKPRYGYELKSVIASANGKTTNVNPQQDGRCRVEADKITSDVAVEISMTEIKEYNLTFTGSNTIFKYGTSTYASQANTSGKYTYSDTASVSFTLTPSMQNSSKDKELNKLVITLDGEEKWKMAVTPPVGEGTKISKTFPDGTEVTVERTGTSLADKGVNNNTSDPNKQCNGGIYTVTVRGAHNGKLHGDISVDTNYKAKNSSEIWPQDLNGVKPIGVVEVTTNFWGVTSEQTLKTLDPTKFEFTGRNEKNIYRVYIKSEDGYSSAKEDITVLMVTDGTEYTGIELKQSTKNGYDWYFDIPADGNGFNPKDIRISVTAKKIVKKFTVKYDYNGGKTSDGKTSFTNTEVYYMGDSFSVTNGGEYPTKEGYTFQGWIMDGKFCKVYTINEDTESLAVKDTATDSYVYTFKAEWAKKDLADNIPFKVYVYFENNNGFDDDNPNKVFDETGAKGKSAYISLSLLNGKLANETSLNLPEGMQFSDYDQAPSEANKSYMISDDGTTVIKIYYRYRRSILIYDGNGGTGSTQPSEEKRVGETVTVATNSFTKTGYTFTGWNTQADGEGSKYAAGDEYKLTEGNNVLYAQWAVWEAEYKVLHYTEDLTGGGYTLAATENLTGQTGTEATAVPKGDLEGFTFDEGHEDNVLNGIIAGNGRLELKVYYTRESYTVTYSYTGTVPTDATELPVEATYKFGDKVKTAEAATAEGYTFSGWNRSAEFEMPAENVEISGSFSANPNTPYKVEYYYQNIADDGYTLDHTVSSNGTTGTEVSVTPAEVTGFKFAEEHTGNVLIGVISGDGELTLKVYYNRRTYKVTYSYIGTKPADATELPAEATYKFGDKVKTAEAATAEGYTFSGWNRSAEFEMPAENVEISGSFTANGDTAYKVLHYTEDLTGGGYTLAVTENLTGQTGTEATAVPKGDLEGFTFDEGHEDNVLNGIIAGNGRLELKVYYTRESYTVTYSYTGTVPTDATELPVEATYKFGADVEIAEAATAEGYTFSSWNADVNGLTIGEDGRFTMPASDVNLTGSFEARVDLQYVVRYYYDGVLGEEVEELNATFGTDIPYDDAKTKLYNNYHYVLKEVKKSGDGTVTIYSEQNMIDIYYLLDENGPNGSPDEIPDTDEYQVIYRGNGGKSQAGENEVKDSNIYPVGEPVYVSDNMFINEGAEFAGWIDQNGTFYSAESFSDGITITMIEGGIILTAQWRKLSIHKNFAPSENESKNFAVGDTISFTITVTNEGDVALNEIVVKDTLTGVIIDEGTGYRPNGNIAFIDSLAPGVSVKVNAHYVVTDAEIGNAGFTNTATAKTGDLESTDTTDPIPLDGIDDQLTVYKRLVRSEEDATGTDSNGNRVFTTGDTVKFEIEVVNSGTRTLKDIDVTDSITDARIVGGGVKNLLTRITEGYTVNGDGTGHISSLAPGESIIFNVEYVIKESDLGNSNFRNVATAKGITADGDPISGEGTSDLIPVESKNPGFSVEKNLVPVMVNGTQKTEYKVGETIHYTITVRNTGNMDLENIAVQDILRNASGSIVFESQNGVQINGNVATIEKLLVGQTIELRCSYEVQREDAGAQISNAAVANGSTPKPTDPDPQPEEDDTPNITVENMYTLTIRYVYATGGTAAPQIVRQYLAGESFGPFYSPTIEGYTASRRFVRSGTDGMPERDVTVIVTYTAAVNPDTPDPTPTPTPPTPDVTPTPPGPGPVPTPVPPTPDTVPPTPDTAPVVPGAPAPTPAAAGVAPVVLTAPAGLVALDDEEIPGAAIELDEDGDPILTTVTDEAVPLTNREIDAHRCCALSFLLMLATMVIYSWYTYSMKRRQKKLVVLKDQLAEEMLNRKLGITGNRKSNM